MKFFEAFDSATSLILAPSDGPAFSDNPPKPLPLSEQQAVYRKLEVKEVGRAKGLASAVLELTYIGQDDFIDSDQ